MHAYGFKPLILVWVAIMAVILGHVTYRAKATDATINMERLMRESSFFISVRILISFFNYSFSAFLTFSMHMVAAS
jgi:hypothetical protein